jgi:hypothetical protein
MALHGSSNFIAGETRKVRLVPGSGGAVLDRCNGFDPSDGSLIPENVGEKISTTSLSGTTPEQGLVAFKDGSTTTLYARDANEAIRTVTDGAAWASAGSVIPIIIGSNPLRVDKHIIYPVDGANPMMKAYEPGSASTKLRPLSFRSPYDYDRYSKPTITASALGGKKLFGCVDAVNLWTSVDSNTHYVFSAADNYITLSLDESTEESILGFEKSLGSTGITLAGYPWLVVDIMVENDEQDYANFGYTASTGVIVPSGYILQLFSDVTCDTLIVEFQIPKCTVDYVNRIAFNLGNLTSTCKGIGIKTAAFYTPPEVGADDHKITLYDATFADNWNFKGNYLMPAIQWDKGYLAELLTGVTAGKITINSSANLVENGDFESGSGEGLIPTDATITGWTGSNAYRKSGGRSGYKVELAGNFWIAESITSSSEVSYRIPITPNQEYKVGLWYSSPNGGSFKMTVDPDVGDSEVYPSSGYYNASNQSEWKDWPQKYTAPAGSSYCTIKIECAALAWRQGFAIDDVYFYGANETTQGWTVVLCHFDPSTPDEKFPEDHWVEWKYCFAGKDLLGEDNFTVMVSNPSEASNPSTYADPWREYTVGIALDNGYVATASINAGGTGYAANDTLSLISNSANGIDGKVKVTSVNAGVVTGISIIDVGSGYSDETGAATQKITGSGNDDCTINITVGNVIDEFGDYVTDALLYRRIYTGGEEGNDSGTWSEWEFVEKIDIANPMSYVDSGLDNPESESYAKYDDYHYVPEIMQITNDYASSARYVAYMDRRIFAGCLDWSEEDGEWKRPTAIEISSYEKTWAFPTTVDSNSEITDGVELDGYAITGTEIRGLLARNDDLLVFLDNEFFLVRGTDPVSGYSITRLDSIGCNSARTLQDCRKMIIWHDGQDFYGYAGGLSEPISRHIIDSTLIDFTKPHNSIYWKDKYVFFCEYNDIWSLVIYDLLTGSWRIRQSDTALNLVGICTDGTTVFGVTTGGNAIDVFGSSTTEAIDADPYTQSPTREVFTQYFVVGAPNYDVQINELFVLAETDQTSAITVSVAVKTHALKENSIPAGEDVLTLLLDSSQTRYRLPLNVKANAVKVELTYVGVHPPTIHEIYVVADEVPVQ